MPTRKDASEFAEKQQHGVAVASAASFLESTDLERWRLLDERGRQTWHYLTDEAVKDWPQSIADRHHLGLPLVKPPSEFLFLAPFRHNGSL